MRGDMTSADRSKIAGQVLDRLPAVRRLALAYAPSRLRAETMGLLALDARLADIVRGAREPVLAQLRLAWWRDTLGKPAAGRPSGEPLLRLLEAWQGQDQALVALVDGWEAMFAEPQPGAAPLVALADARADAFAALAVLAGLPEQAAPARALARSWALCDIAANLRDPAEIAAALALLQEMPARHARLGRPLRPLVVLHGLARRALSGGRDAAGLVPFDMFYALRLGLLGR